MKKILVLTASLALLFILLLLLLPVFLRNNISSIIEKQADKYINAQPHIESIRLSMFKNFPDLHVNIRNIILSGKKECAGDTLLHVPSFNASVNVLSLLKGDKVIVNRILLKDARFTLQIPETGYPNRDIFSRDSVPSSPTEKVPEISPKENDEEIILNDIRIENLFLEYKNENHRTYARIHRLDLNLSGNLAETQTLLKTELSAQGLSLRQGNLQWLNNTDILWQSEISAHFRERIFDIQKNSLSVNDLKLLLNGRIGIEKEKYNLSLRLKVPDTRFESLLALIPKELRKQFDGIQTTGDFTLDITTQGSYYTGHLPHFHAELAVHDASLKYPDLPESVNHINLALKVQNPGGPLDSTQINLQQLTFRIADNPFSMNLLLTNPVHPDLQGSAKGHIDFARLEKALPLKNTSIQGLLYTDLQFSGKYDDIEKKEYEKLKAQGEISLNQVTIKTPAFPQGISIPSGKLTVTPAALEINKIKAHIHSSDFTLRGSLSNYLPYLLKKRPLKANLVLNSQQINLNELNRATSSNGTSPDNTPHPKEPSLPELSANLDLHLQTHIDKLFSDQLTIHHIQGNIKLAAPLTSNGTLNLKRANGNGYITAQNIWINRNPSLQKLASTLKNDELNRISISALKIEFEMQNGNLTVKPFKTTLAGNPATIHGYQSAKGNIAYHLSLNVERKYFGNDIENILKNIPGSKNIKNLDLDIRIEGTLNKPEVKPDLSKALKTIQKEAEKELRKKAQKGFMKELNKLFR